MYLRGFPKGQQGQVFRLPLSTQRTDYLITNGPSSLDRETVQEVSGHRWRVEQVHREEKRLTGIQNCPCRKERIQRNHIGCAILVWSRLKQIADQTKNTVYQIKQGLLDEYMIQQLRNPTVKMADA